MHTHRGIIINVLNNGHQLSDATVHSTARFGEGQGAIHLDGLACNGSEYRLTDCKYDRDTSDCGHYEDAGVLCSGMCKQLIYACVQT